MAIKLYWSRGSGHANPNRRNFGDYLSPLIVEAVSGKKVEYAPLSSADLMAIGTILVKEKKARFFGFKRKIHVWGSGCGHADETFSSRHFYHAVRGVETLNRIQGIADPLALGDPGLLAPLLISQPVARKYKIGFVPHYVDKNLPESLEFIEKNSDVHFIDVYRPPVEVLQEIATCEFVVSSSLHGLVVADAFKIANVRIKLSSQIKSDLKFDDYYSAFGIRQPDYIDARNLKDICGRVDAIADTYHRPNLDEVTLKLYESFPRDLG